MIKNQHPILTLIFIMVAIVVVVESLTLYLLYDAEFKEQAARLTETAQSHARTEDTL